MAVAAAMGLRLALEARLGAGLPTYITFYPAVMGVATLAGFGPGVLSTAVAGVTAAYWIIPPVGQFFIHSPIDRMGLAIFIAMGLFMSVIAELYRRDRRKAAAYDRQAALRLRQEALRERDERFRLMANAMPQLSWTARADGYIDWHNERWYEYTGTTPEQMEGWGWQSVHDPVELPEVLKRWKDSIASGQPFEMTFPLRGADGSFRRFLTRVVPMKDAGGSVVQWFGTNTDVEELTRAQQALQKSEALYRGIGEAIDYGVWVCEPSGRNTYASESFLNMVGITQEQCSDFGWGNVLHPDDAEATIAAWQECVRTGDAWDREHRFRGVDGNWHHVLARGVPIRDERGSIVCWAGINLDITALKVAQAELQQAKESAEAAGNAKAAFLANMSHEIRTPLNVIIGLGHLLRRDIVDPLARQKLNQLCANSDHLLALINDILDLSKIEAEQLTLDRSEFQLGTVVEKVTRMVADRAREKGLTLTVDIAPSTRDLQLIGDPLRLAQVLINLCDNAVKFTDYGTVRLTLRCLSEKADQATLRFAVEDTGCGIAPADQARLFQPFSQGDVSMTREQGGTGLGLAISQQLMALMGGTIQLDSEVGTGSTFSFEISLPCTAPVRAPAPVPVPTHFYGKRVLFADDHPQSQEILLEMLEDLGCDADVAADGVEAVECAQARDYDLILMDMQMPKMDGLTATRAIRALPGYRDTPILALTANAFAEDRQRCLEAGMNGHLAKPVTPATLAEMLGRWLPDLNVADDESPLCDDELSRALRQIQGLEVAPGWRRSPEHVVGYCAQLARFIESNDPEMTRLRAHLAAGDHEAARHLAHNLKGIAGLLGATRVASLASVVERELRSTANTSAVMPLASECDAELARLADALRTLPISITQAAGA